MTETLLPLTPTVFHILLSLSQGEDRHGYGIIVDIRERTQGEVQLGTGTLYTAVKRLLGQGLLEEAQGVDEKGQPRSLYRVTALGRATLEAETARLERQLAWARQGVVL